MMKRADVAVVIVNYKTKEMTADTINSLLGKTSGLDYSVVVVDNDSGDGSVEFLKKKFGEKIKIIASKRNLGFGAGNNLGIKNSDSRYVFLLNPDTILINNPIKIFFDFMEGNPKVGVCGGNLYDKDGASIHTFNTFPKNCLFKRFSNRLRNTFFKKKVGEIYRVDSVSGADYFVRRSTLDVAGLFDEDFFMYYEETELSHRIMKAGYQSYIIQDAKIIHLEGGSQKGELEINKMKRNWLSKYIYFYKVYGKRGAKRIYKYDLLSLRFKWLIQFNKRKRISEIIQAKKECYQGYLEKFKKLA